MFDFRATVRGLSASSRQHWRLVAITVGLTLLLATVYVMAWPPIYRAEALLMGERDMDGARDGFYGGWNIFRKDDQRTELELMVSGPVIAEVVRREKLTYDDVYHPIGSQLRYFWDGSWLGRSWRAFKEMIVPPEADAPSRKEEEFAKTVIDLKASVNVDPVGEAFLGRMIVKGPSPRVAQITNTMLEVYQEQRTKRYESEAQRAVAGLDKELISANAELAQAEAARVKFAKENGVLFDFQKEGFDVKQLSDMEFGIAASRARVATLEANLAELKRQLDQEPVMKTSSSLYEINGVRENLRAKRTEMQAALVLAQTRYQDSSPEVQDLKRNIANFDALIAQSSERIEKNSTDAVNPVRQTLLTSYSANLVDLSATKAGLEVLERNAARYANHLALLPGLMTKMKSLERDLNLALAKANELTSKRMQAAVSAASTKSAIPSIRVVETATRPVSKYWPRLPILYPLALFFGLALGVALAHAMRLARGRVHRENLGKRAHDVALYGGVTYLPHRAPMLGVVRMDPSDGVAPTRELPAS